MFYKGPKFYDIHTERGGLENCQVFTDSIVFKQQIYCSFCGWGVGGSGWFVDVIIVWSLILKLTWLKNVFSFGVCITVKQPSLLLNICTLKLKSNLKHF